MSKHTPTPWVIKKAARASACGIKTVEDIFGANGYRVLVDPMPADRTLIVDSVNALADRDPSKLADLEKAVAAYIHADPMVRGEAYRDMVNALTAFSPDSLKRSPGPRLIAGMNKFIDRVKSGEFRKEAP